MRATVLPIIHKKTSRGGDVKDWVQCPKHDNEVTNTNKCLKCEDLCIILASSVKCKYTEYKGEYVKSINI